MSFIESEKKKLENKFAENGNKFMLKIVNIVQEYQQAQADLSASYKALTDEVNKEKPVVEEENTTNKKEKK